MASPDELWDASWQPSAKGTFPEFKVTTKKVSGIQSSQPQGKATRAIFVYRRYICRYIYVVFFLKFQRNYIVLLERAGTLHLLGSLKKGSVRLCPEQSILVIIT